MADGTITPDTPVRQGAKGWAAAGQIGGLFGDQQTAPTPRAIVSPAARSPQADAMRSPFLFGFFFGLGFTIASVTVLVISYALFFRALAAFLAR